MNKIKYILTLLFFVSSFSCHAGWWIFGNTKAEVDYKYLTLNGVSWDELDEKFKVYPDMFPNGITIQGEAHVSNGKVGSVRISVKDGEWKPAKVSADGGFVYTFPIIRGVTYKIKVEISNTAGKTNDVAATQKIIEVTKISAKDAVKRILKEMNQKYRSQSIEGFMQYVSKNFQGDSVMLEDALRSDFTLFNSSKIELIPMNITFNDDLRVVVDVKYIRTMTTKTNSKILTDRGVTRFTFKLGYNDLELYSMQFPIIFGVSDAANIATGFVNPGGNPNTLVVDEDEPKMVPFDSAVILVGAGASVISGIVSVISTDSVIDTLSFASESVSRESHSDFSNTVLAKSDIETGDIAVGHLYFRGKSGTLIKKLTGTDLNSFTEVPTTGYVPASGQSVVCPGVFAIKTAMGKYAIIALSGFSLVGSVTHYTITYKYQTNGTNKF